MALRGAKRAKILWVDLEMTGLDPEKDRILEVAAIATDWKFREIGIYAAAKKVDKKIIKRQMVGDFWESFTSVRDALISQNKTAKPGKAVEAELIAFIQDNFDTSKPVLLAGNSIHMDRRFIDKEWPEFAKLLHYRMLDVTSWKVVVEGKYRRKFAKPEQHRALDDIRGSIQELQYYLEKTRF